METACFMGGLLSFDTDEEGHLRPTGAGRPLRREPRRHRVRAVGLSTGARSIGTPGRACQPVRTPARPLRLRRDRGLDTAACSSRYALARSSSWKLALRPLGFASTQTSVLPILSAWSPQLA